MGNKVTRPNAEFLAEKETRDLIKDEVKKQVETPELSTLLDGTDKFEDKVIILLSELLRVTKDKAK